MIIDVHKILCVKIFQLFMSNIWITFKMDTANIFILKKNLWIDNIAWDVFILDRHFGEDSQSLRI